MVSRPFVAGLLLTACSTQQTPRGDHARVPAVAKPEAVAPSGRVDTLTARR